MKKNMELISINGMGVAKAYLTVFTHPASLPAILSFIGAVAWKFFIFQYLEKIHIRRVKITLADHKLDSTIPFREDTAKTYLDFINFWIRPLSLAVEKFGWHRGALISRRFIKKIAFAYNEAYRVYSKNITTTSRPKATTKTVRNIQRADPHYCCVPSLHIVIVLLVIFFWRKNFAAEGYTPAEMEKWNRELYDRGLSIAQSVLYMKQHSVNCIPAAMFMITVTEKELVTPEDIYKFIDEIFKDSKDIKPEDRNAIQQHIRETYSQYLEKYEGSEESDRDWANLILQWIRDYKPYSCS